MRAGALLQDSRLAKAKPVSPGWELNPRMAVLQTAALTTSPPGLGKDYFSIDLRPKRDIF